MTTEQQDAVDRAKARMTAPKVLPKPTADQVVEVLRTTHPDAVQAAYWRVRATLAEQQFQHEPTLEHGHDTRGADEGAGRPAEGHS